MNRPAGNEYSPDFVSPPGETLRELLAERRMCQAELAERTGRPKKTINEIMQGKSAITPETALQLENVLGVPARFWNNREARYREYIARREEEKLLARSVGWLRQLPISFMIKKKWIRRFSDKADQVKELLTFFGVSSPSQWEAVFQGCKARFRKSSAFPIDPGAVAAWLRQGEIQARQIETSRFIKKTFFEVLQEVRLLTRRSPDVFEKALPALCAQAGVAVVFVPAPRGCRASGATQWLSPGKALIQLSLRYRSDDQLWFSFFHESGHIVRHPKKAVFLDTQIGSEGREEDEANRFAADLLMPASRFHQFLEHTSLTKDEIIVFADDLNVAPGIVVGRLQHDELLPWNTALNKLKKRFRFVEDS